MTSPTETNPETTQDETDPIIEKLMAKVSPMLTGAVKNHLAKEMNKLRTDFETKLAPAVKEELPPEDKNAKEIAALKAELRKERRQSMEDKFMLQLTTELTGKVKPGSESVVAKYLAKAERIFEFDAKDKAVFQYGDRSCESLTEAVSEFLRSSDASIYLPAPVAKPAAKPNNPRVSANLPSSAPTVQRPLSKQEKLQRAMQNVEKMKSGQ